jgi:hypothetical protein
MNSSIKDETFLLYKRSFNGLIYLIDKITNTTKLLRKPSMVIKYI